jgi:hypothetical protein
MLGMRSFMAGSVVAVLVGVAEGAGAVLAATELDRWWSRLAAAGRCRGPLNKEREKK